ncbi:hypothetical protein B0H19DRAFT_1261949 [Mycena capillaripes]|nr:hypothetical protein B0H19DRAFT_1261949 [Mycena capillaripes]
MFARPSSILLSADIPSAVIFKNKTSIGVVVASYFNLYPIPTFALEFLSSNGRLVPATFEEKHLLKKYTMHLNDIGHWADLNKSVANNFCAKWYTRAL